MGKNAKAENAPHRCSWVNPDNPAYIRYHDEEWGRPCREDRKLFEMLVLESFQAGLSWECVLNKREAFARAFDGFDPEAVSRYGAAKEEELMADPGIIRNRRKIRAAAANAKVFMAIREEWGSFSDYIWHFTGGRQVVNVTGEFHATTPLSDEVSRDLRRRGMSFVGSTIVYSYLQAIGVVNDHEPGCFLFGGG